LGLPSNPSNQQFELVGVTADGTEIPRLSTTPFTLERLTAAPFLGAVPIDPRTLAGIRAGSRINTSQQARTQKRPTVGNPSAGAARHRARKAAENFATLDRAIAHQLATKVLPMARQCAQTSSDPRIVAAIGSIEADVLQAAKDAVKNQGIVAQKRAWENRVLRNALASETFEQYDPSVISRYLSAAAVAADANLGRQARATTALGLIDQLRAELKDPSAQRDANVYPDFTRASAEEAARYSALGPLIPIASQRSTQRLLRSRSDRRGRGQRAGQAYLSSRGLYAPTDLRPLAGQEAEISRQSAAEIAELMRGLAVA